MVALASSAIDRLTAYRTDGTELGSEMLFPGSGNTPSTGPNAWYAPDQTPALATARVTFTGTMVDSPGTPWTAVVQAGGFGVCVDITGTEHSEHLGGKTCLPPAALAAKGLDFTEPGSGDPAVFSVGPLDPSVTRIVATLEGGQEVQLPSTTIDGWRMFADVLAPGKALAGLTAYEGDGSVYGHENLSN